MVGQRNVLDFKRVDLRRQLDRTVLVVCFDFCQLSLEALDFVVHNANALGGFLRTPQSRGAQISQKEAHLLDLVNIDQS